MTTESGPFSEWSQRNDPLSRPLDARAGAVLSHSNTLPPDEILSLSAEVLADRVLGEVVPMRGDPGVGHVIGHPAISAERLTLALGPGQAGELRGSDFESHLPCWVWEVVFQWSCPKDLLWKWPDKSGEHLRVFDNHPQLGTPPTIKWLPSDDRLLARCFTQQTPNLEPGEAIKERATRPEALFSEAVEHVNDYVEAFRKQVGEWQATLRARLIEHLGHNQELLRLTSADRIRVEQLLGSWRVGPLQLQAPTLAKEVRPVSAPVLPQPLPDASLEDIIQVTNRWASAVEKYPPAYLDLEEERLADQLTACLNGAFGRADREVFIGKGRTDFCVQANTVGVDGTAEVFAGEAKVWDGAVSLTEAVGQALSNLTRRTRTALLVVFVKARDSFSESCRTGKEALAGDERTKGAGPDRAGRPCYRMTSALDPEVVVELCLIFVDLTRPKELTAKPKGKRKG
jgi:hypothetical protein